MAIGATDHHLYVVIAGNKINKTVQYYGPFDSWMSARAARQRLVHPELAEIVPLKGIA